MELYSEEDEEDETGDSGRGPTPPPAPRRTGLEDISGSVGCLQPSR